MSFTPGTWTTEELREEKKKPYSQKWPAFLRLLQDPELARFPTVFLLVHCPEVLAGFYSQTPSPPGSGSSYTCPPPSFPEHPQLSIKISFQEETRFAECKLDSGRPALCALVNLSHWGTQKAYSLWT